MKDLSRPMERIKSWNCGICENVSKSRPGRGSRIGLTIGSTITSRQRFRHLKMTVLCLRFLVIRLSWRESNANSRLMKQQIKGSFLWALFAAAAIFTTLWPEKPHVIWQQVRKTYSRYLNGILLTGNYYFLLSIKRIYFHLTLRWPAKSLATERNPSKRISKKEEKFCTRFQTLAHPVESSLIAPIILDFLYSKKIT